MINSLWPSVPKFWPTAKHLPFPRLRRPEQIGRAAIVHLDEIRHRPITIGELASSQNVSHRTLERAFVSVTSFTPGTHIRISRLNGVRRMLMSGSYTEEPVTNPASHWGFTHLGRFSADYKWLFGELPSQTVQSSN